MKAKQLLKNLYNLSHDVIWEIEANREIEGKSFIKPSDLKRITELIDNISNDVEKAIDQTREETIREVEEIVGRFTARVDLNNFGKILSQEDRKNHQDILWLKDKINKLKK